MVAPGRLPVPASLTKFSPQNAAHSKNGFLRCVLWRRNRSDGQIYPSHKHGSLRGSPHKLSTAVIRISGNCNKSRADNPRFRRSLGLQYDMQAMRFLSLQNLIMHATYSSSALSGEGGKDSAALLQGGFRISFHFCLNRNTARPIIHEATRPSYRQARPPGEYSVARESGLHPSSVSW